MENWKILYLEDDKEMQDLVQLCLPPETKFQSVGAIEDAQSLLQNEAFHLILVDLKLDNESGFDFLEEIKSCEFSFIPSIIVITSSDSEIDEIKCHNYDVHEFVRKPIRKAPLAALLAKHLRRFEENKRVLRVGPLFIDAKKMEVRIKMESGEQSLPLTIKEYKLLMKLVDKPGTPLSREELFVDIWEGSVEVQTRTIDMHVSALRKKLGPFGSTITSVRGVGYSFDAEKAQS